MVMRLDRPATDVVEQAVTEPWRATRHGISERICVLQAEARAPQREIVTILDDLGEAYREREELERDLFLDRLAQHMPGLAPVLSDMRDHLDDTTNQGSDCCPWLKLMGAWESAIGDGSRRALVLNPRRPGAEYLVNLPPCEEDFTLYVDKDSLEPTAIVRDGRGYRVKPVSRLPWSGAEYMVQIVDRGFGVPLDLAWREARREAQKLGVAVVERERGRAVFFDEMVAEIAEILTAMDDAREARGRALIAARRAAREAKKREAGNG
jgi:hypothetical protein